MGPNAVTAETRSNETASEGEEVAALESLQFTDEIHRLILAPTSDNATSLTALLELPPSQAVQLLHSPASANLIAAPPPSFEPLSKRNLLFKETSNNSSLNFGKVAVKSEPAETETENENESSQPLGSDPTVEKRNIKRKEREKKVKGSTKKSKTAEDAEKLPYVHVRARRGQATDSHSLAERARREKINARMKLLQELVPGCDKISGTALVLDEIINHVQALQHQVEFLSMRLAAVNPRIDFNLDNLFTAEEQIYDAPFYMVYHQVSLLRSGSLMDSNFPSMVMPLMWPDVQVNGNRQEYQQQWQFDASQQPVWGREEVCNNYITPENSLLSYDSSANSATLHANQTENEAMKFEEVPTGRVLERLL